VILPAGDTIPYVATGPAFMGQAASQAPMTGNFTWRDEFSADELDRAWHHVRVPRRRWADLGAKPGWLAIQPLGEGLETLANPSFLGRRQQHIVFEASTALEVPATEGTEAGLVVFQNEHYWYFLGVRRTADGVETFLRKSAGTLKQTLAVAEIPVGQGIRLKITGDHGAYSFAFDADGKGWQWLRQDEDGTVLSTEVAGGFIGAVVGPYARTAPGL
jgi:xylan 1,4-beta-xylosidase